MGELFPVVECLLHTGLLDLFVYGALALAVSTHLKLHVALREQNVHRWQRIDVSMSFKLLSDLGSDL